MNKQEKDCRILYYYYMETVTNHANQNIWHLQLSIHVNHEHNREKDDTRNTLEMELLQEVEELLEYRKLMSHRNWGLGDNLLEPREVCLGFGLGF